MFKFIIRKCFNVSSLKCLEMAFYTEPHFTPPSTFSHANISVAVFKILSLCTSVKNMLK